MSVSRSRIWNEDLDLVLLEGLQERQANIHGTIKHNIYDEIIEELLPTFTYKQCRVRISRIKTAFDNYNRGEKYRKYRITRKVYEKMLEMSSNCLAVGRPRKADYDNFSDWNDELDVRLLDALIRKQVTNSKGVMKELEGIIQESLPDFTVDQCRERLDFIKRIYRYNRKSANLSKSVLERLEILSKNFKKNDSECHKIAFPVAPAKFWDDENDLRLLNGFSELDIQFHDHHRHSVWETIAKKVMADKATADQCRIRCYRLREGYHTTNNIGRYRKITPKVYSKMCEMYDSKPQKLANIEEMVPKEPEPDICRCCGQIDENLMDLEQGPDMMEWFLTFTGLAVEQLVRPYTKICKICGEKLSQAHKFRELCLMGDQIIQTELANAPPTKEPILEDQVESTVYVDKSQKCCAVCGKMVHMYNIRQHESQHTREDQANQESTCEFCGKKFQQLVRYKRHLEFHIDGKIHKCPKCPEKFTCISVMKNHCKTHKKSRAPGLNRKGFLCTICGKVYELQSALTYHMNYHNGVKPFKCPHCDQRFARPQGLNKHVDSRHNNVRYPCNQCDLVYRTRGKLKLHVVLKHQGAILRCDLCQLESTTLKSFKFHLKNSHKKGFNQSVHVILGNGQKLIRLRKLDESLIQTEKIDLNADEPEISEGSVEMEETIEKR